jgi:hypothetical protein
MTVRGFAIHQYSKFGYEDSFQPIGLPAGMPEEALDCAAGLYLTDPTAWLPPTNQRLRPLASHSAFGTKESQLLEASGSFFFKGK